MYILYSKHIIPHNGAPLQLRFYPCGLILNYWSTGSTKLTVVDHFFKTVMNKAVVCLHFCIDQLSFGAYGIVANSFIYYYLSYDFHKMAEQNSASLPDLPEQPHYPTLLFNFPKRVYEKYYYYYHKLRVIESIASFLYLIMVYPSPIQLC